MSFSSCTTGSHPERSALAFLVLLQVGALLLSGCAHARAGRAEPPRAPARGSAPAGSLDPSEEITPRELASIPEPVPASVIFRRFIDETPVYPSKPAPKAVPEPSDAGSTAGQPSSVAPEVSGPRSDPTFHQPTEPTLATPMPIGPWVWRVQILATPDLAVAERVSREASERLGTSSRIDSEPPLFKIRLGAFGSEADAQVLKERAVEMGYPGAFRVKIRVAATDE